MIDYWDLIAMQFKDRQEAGKKLAEKLAAYKNAPDAVVVALPRGGVVLGRIVADALGLPLDVVVARKIGAPGNPEYAIGAVTVSGDVIWNEAEKAMADAAYCDEEVRKQMAEARRRQDTYRGGWPPRDLKGKTVIIVDDGIATGFTVRASARTAKNEGARKVVIAVPVAPADSLASLASEFDEIVVLHSPELFFAIGGFYGDFPQVDDKTVIDLLRR